MIDGRRRRWFALSGLYPHGETASRIQEKFGRDGLLVWVLFLAACKRSPAQGTFCYTTEESGWGELGLLDPGDRPRFSLDDFWKFTGRLKQTRRTQSGRVVNVTATHWKDWQDASTRRVEAERKARKRAEKTADNPEPNTRTDSDLDLERDRDTDAFTGPGPDANGDASEKHHVRKQIETSLGRRAA